ncbi:MAG: sugar ABC transporter permease [Treponema sp.]|nr:sugar ABC transporter permease [Treponema sp.]
MAKKSAAQDKIGYLFISPYYIFLIVFILVPICVNLYLSFTNYNLNVMDFIGFRNYTRMFQDPVLKVSLVNTLVYTLFTMIFSIGGGLIVALMLTETGRWIGVFRTMIFLPYVISMACAAMVWLWIFEPGFGLLNQIIINLGGKSLNWVYDNKLAMGCLVAVSFWKLIGYNMVIFTAGLLAIPSQLYEAATIDGAGRLRQIWSITLPMLRPTTFFLVITGFINNFNVFELVNILTNGGPVNSTTTIMHQVYINGFVLFRFGYASTITVLILIIVAAITLLNFRFMSKGQDLDLS